MKRFALLDKNICETPLEAIHKWKKQNPEYSGVPASYAGRLDPMASGKLLVLLGDECKRQNSYTDLDKEYEVEVLLDIGSDTGDVLGMPEYNDKITHLAKKALSKVIGKEHGTHLRKYPAFSSKTVNGKPLFLHKLEGNISSIDIPEHNETIYRIKNLGLAKISNSELRTRILSLLDLVSRTDEPSKKLGEDFRVDDIRRKWESVFAGVKNRNFAVIRIRVTCGSGTYMRSLAERIGESLHTKALALSIKRTRIGKYIHIFNGVGFWISEY